jgi:hypothetical protein
MAIKKISDDIAQGAIDVQINNGDLQALTKITDEWDFKDIESALRYAVAVLSIAKDRKLFYETDEGDKRVIEPADSLKKDSSDGQAS